MRAVVVSLVAGLVVAGAAAVLADVRRINARLNALDEEQNALHRSEADEEFVPMAAWGLPAWEYDGGLSGSRITTRRN